MTMTFRNSKIIYYGPHPCRNCGVMVAKMGQEWGGTAFTYPATPVYPNTEWHPHVCDPHLVFKYKAKCAEWRVKEVRSHAEAVEGTGARKGSWTIMADGEFISTTQCTLFMTPGDAWVDAFERMFPDDDPRNGAPFSIE